MTGEQYLHPNTQIEVMVPFNTKHPVVALDVDDAGTFVQLSEGTKQHALLQFPTHPNEFDGQYWVEMHKLQLLRVRGPKGATPAQTQSAAASSGEGGRQPPAGPEPALEPKAMPQAYRDALMQTQKAHPAVLTKSPPGVPMKSPPTAPPPGNAHHRASRQQQCQSQRLNRQSCKSRRKQKGPTTPSR